MHKKKCNDKISKKEFRTQWTGRVIHTHSILVTDTQISLLFCINMGRVQWLWLIVQYPYKTKRLSWNSGKPHGKNVENRKQNLPPSTRHRNAPVPTQGTFALYFDLNLRKKILLRSKLACVQRKTAAVPRTRPEPSQWLPVNRTRPFRRT